MNTNTDLRGELIEAIERMRVELNTYEAHYVCSCVLGIGIAGFNDDEVEIERGDLRAAFTNEIEAIEKAVTSWVVAGFDERSTHQFAIDLNDVLVTVK